jgi:hypothetical protein
MLRTANLVAQYGGEGVGVDVDADGIVSAAVDEDVQSLGPIELKLRQSEIMDNKESFEDCASAEAKRAVIMQ